MDSSSARRERCMSRETSGASLPSSTAILLTFLCRADHSRESNDAQARSDGLLKLSTVAHRDGPGARWRRATVRPSCRPTHTSMAGCQHLAVLIVASFCLAASVDSFGSAACEQRRGLLLSHHS